MNPSPVQKSPEGFWVLLFWAYLLGVSFLVQFVFLPGLFPQWHAGHGLLNGTDSLVFHEIAEGQAQRMVEEGWVGWKLVPRGQIAAGIASIFYYLISPEPWVMIPLYTFLFSLAAFLMGRAYALLEAPTRSAWPILSVLPFLGFPSAVLLYAQLLKDVFFIFGNFLFLYGWMKWIKKGDSSSVVSWPDFFALFFSLTGGYLVVWLVRPYWGPVLFLLTFLGLLLVSVGEIIRLIRKEPFTEGRLRYLGMTVLMVLVMTTAQIPKKIPDVLTSPAPDKEQRVVTMAWKRTPWLPLILDRQMELLARSRLAFVVKYPEAGSTMDKDRMFYEAKDLILYLPRAFYVGFFMPTPAMAAGSGTSPAGTALRRIVGGEMLLLYLCYPLVLIGLWRWRKKTEAGFFLFWAVSGILLYTITSPNIGALYRFRYGFLTALSGAGIYGGLCRLFGREG